MKERLHDAPPPGESARKAALKAGFTLIEMSMVLVIIGLVVGGILVGVDLVKMATVRSEASELEHVESAIYAFRDKYGAYPGDISNATSFFGTTDANGYTIANGNGDGFIASTISFGGSESSCLSGPATQFTQGAPPNEVEEVFHHLNLAGMGNYNITPPAAYASSGLTNLPTAVMGGGMLVTCLTGGATGIPTAFESGTAIVIGGASAPYNTRIEYVMGWAGDGPLLTIAPDMASRLDTKIDDGLPQTGRVGVPLTCSGGPPSTYTAMTRTCNVSVVKKIWN
jgi:prepilin-type N-terminal cleavage/methylation domain-containing protein